MTLKDIKKLFKEKYHEFPPSKAKLLEIRINYKKAQAIANQAGGHYRKLNKLDEKFDVFKTACEAFEGMK